MEVLGALASVLSTLAVTSVLLYEAIRRVLHPSPEPINGKGKVSAAWHHNQFLGMYLAWKSH
jgi:Co/Zn/Cd efflux system component